MLVIGNNHASDDLVVSSEIFCGAVHHDIGAIFERSEKDRRCKSGVDAQQNVVLFGDLDHFLKITNLEQRIGRSLNPEHSSFGGNYISDGIGVGGVNVADIDPLVGGHVIQQTCHASIDVIPANNMISCG